MPSSSRSSRRSIRSARSCGVTPRATPIRAAARRPYATASPWSRSRKPAAASMACPSECPRFSAIRAPASRSSARTTSTFAHAARSTTSASAPDSTAAGSPGGDRRALGLQRREQPLVAQGGHLHGLGEGGAALPLVERREDGDVDDDRGRLVERADEVLALGQVDAGLAADRRVELRDERRRDLDEGHAAEVGRGEEPGRVAERPAADGDERLAAARPAGVPARARRPR